MNRKLLFAVFIFLIVLTVISLKIPFFWDSTFFSALSIHFSEKGFNGFIAPLSNDTGGFPLYSAYLAVVWKLFGKSLAVSHFALLPFLLGTAYEYQKLAKRYLNGTALSFAMVLLLIEPVFLTQSILMGYDVIITCFFLLALNAILEKRNLLLSFAFTLLLLVSVRGMMLGVALLLIDLSVNGTEKFARLRNYIPAAIILLAWMFYHHSRTGWFLFSPERAGNAESFSNLKMVFRQLVYIGWKNIDLGRITLWLCLAVGYFYFLRRSVQGKELLRLTFIPLITLAVFMCLIRNPIGHKYFMPVFLLLNIGVCLVIQHLERKSARLMIFFSLVVSLITGNFIEYPQRYGNAWDSSLKVLPYFEMKTEMDEYITKRDLNRNFIFTQFPLTADHFSTDLKEYSRCYADIEDLPINDIGYFIYSNIINTNRAKDLETIKNTWIPEKELKRGQVELVLFRNPFVSGDQTDVLSLIYPDKVTMPSPKMAMP